MAAGSRRGPGLRRLVDPGDRRRGPRLRRRVAGRAALPEGTLGPVLTLVVGATIAGRTKRLKIGFAVQVLPSDPSAAPRRGRRDARSRQQGTPRVRRGPKRSARALHGLQHPLRGKPGAVRRDARDPPESVDRGAVHVRGQVLSVPRRLRDPQAVPEAAPAAPRRGDVRGVVRGASDAAGCRSSWR